MAYTAWSVVYGEQPTAAKWNQLGTNDAGFKDGTNIDNNAILTRHILNANITKDKLAAGIKGVVDYSTSEVLTDAVWTDGKPIYKKTFSIGALPNNTIKYVDHNIVNVDRWVSIRGTAQNAGKTQVVPLPYLNISVLGYGISVSINVTQLVIEAGFNRSDMTGFITVEYTKV